MPPTTIRIAHWTEAGGTGTASIDIDKLLRAADTAMYTAKGLGRDQVQVFRPVDDEAAIAKAPISAAARMRANLIGQAAFEAANAELLESISDRCSTVSSQASCAASSCAPGRPSCAASR